jgi:hypothetical protein
MHRRSGAPSLLAPLLPASLPPAPVFRVRQRLVWLSRDRLSRGRLFLVPLSPIRLFPVRLFPVRLYRVRLYRVRLYRVRVRWSCLVLAPSVPDRVFPARPIRGRLSHWSGEPRNVPVGGGPVDRPMRRRCSKRPQSEPGLPRLRRCGPAKPKRERRRSSQPRRPGRGRLVVAEVGVALTPPRAVQPADRPRGVPFRRRPP